MKFVFDKATGAIVEKVEPVLPTPSEFWQTWWQIMLDSQDILDGKEPRSGAKV